LLAIGRVPLTAWQASGSILRSIIGFAVFLTAWEVLASIGLINAVLLPSPTTLFWATPHSKPPFPKQKQPIPGKTNVMEPVPDHGDRSYRGCGGRSSLAEIVRSCKHVNNLNAARHGEARELALFGLLPLHGAVYETRVTRR
jgi:hypothetical protein